MNRSESLKILPEPTIFVCRKGPSFQPSSCPRSHGRHWQVFPRVHVMMKRWFPETDLARVEGWIQRNRYKDQEVMQLSRNARALGHLTWDGDCEHEQHHEKLSTGLQDWWPRKIQGESEVKVPGQSELSLQHKGFPELSSLISTGFLESRDDKTGPNSQFKQVPADSCVHCTERIIQEVDVCVLIHGSRKHRETSGEDTSHCLGLISESWWYLTTPGSFYKPRERAKTLLHTGPPCERGLCAHVH